MKITVLVENTISENPNVKNLSLQAEHGLSLHIQTEFDSKKNYQILFDMGQSNLFQKNAKLLGVNLESVDFAVLSHGHYDHGGLSSSDSAQNGLFAFSKINQTSPIYINQNAFSQNYNGSKKYIGLDQSLLQNDELKSRFLFTKDKTKITEDILLFSCNDYPKIVPTNPYGLMQLKNGNFIPDNFNHEHYLLIQENKKKILISGCSHKGILNIVEWFKPDFLIGGFHFKSIDVENPLEKQQLIDLGKKLFSYNTKFFTCHCTGTSQFEILKPIMKEKLEYIGTGDSIEI